MALPSAIEVVTLFVDGISEAKAFYSKVFEPKVVYEDEVSCVLKFDGAMVNLLQASNAPLLVQPASVAAATSGARILLTIKVADVDAVCAELQGRGVALLNGPIDRPRRTAAFADPSGHVWEVAQVLT
jgi:catechol 2,3-dioxygenase-like lactoylglutathione lyase family enzyme